MPEGICSASRRKLWFWRLVVTAVVVAVVPLFVQPAHAQYAIDDGSYGHVPGLNGMSEWPNGHEISYTKRLQQSPWFVHGKCVIYKYSTLRTIWSWNMHAYYGDVRVQCYPPPDPNGDNNRGVQTYCMEVINWAPGPSGSINLGRFNGGTDQRGVPDCKMFSISRTQPGDGHADPYSGLWVSRAEIRLYAEPGYEFGKRVVNGYQYPEAPQDWGNIWVDVENSGSAPGGHCTPAGGGPCFNYARIFVADMVGYWSSTPVNWCQDGVCPPSSPPPSAKPYAPEVETAVPPDDPTTDVTSAATMAQVGLRRAREFWRSRGQLSACMRDDVRVQWIRSDTKMVEPADNGTTHERTPRDYDVGGGPAFMVVFGCNVKHYHNQGNPGQGGPGRITDPKIYVNQDYRWTTKRLCVAFAHELGHMDRQGTHPWGYMHSDSGALPIMSSDYRTNVDPRTWPPCQSG